MKNRNWFWGIFFIFAAAAVVYLMSGGASSDIGIFTVSFMVLLAAVFISSAIRLNFFGMMFSAAFILMVVEKWTDIGIPDRLIPWGLLAAAFFLGLGLTIIFKPKNKGHWFSHHTWKGHGNHSGYNDAQGGADAISDSTDGEVIRISSSFSEGTKYINSANLRKVNLHCSFGALKVFFNDAQIDPGGAEVVFDCSFSGVEIYIPKSWRVNNNISVTLGGVEEKNKQYVVDGPVLNLTGNVSLGGVDITYI